MGEYMQIEGLLDKVRSTGMGGISADDDRAVEKLEAKLAGLEAMQEEMKPSMPTTASIKRWRAVPSCPPRKLKSSSPLWHPTGAKSRTLSVLSAYQQQRQHPPHTPAH